LIPSPVPPAKRPLVEEEHADNKYLATSKSPKSVLLPVVAMVIYEIVFKNEPASPPPKRPLVFDEQAPKPSARYAISPKSIAFPVVAIVT
jgi:hypothetical protein